MLGKFHCIIWDFKGFVVVVTEPVYLLSYVRQVMSYWYVMDVRFHFAVEPLPLWGLLFQNDHAAKHHPRIPLPRCRFCLQDDHVFIFKLILNRHGSTAVEATFLNWGFGNIFINLLFDRLQTPIWMSDLCAHVFGVELTEVGCPSSYPPTGILLQPLLGGSRLWPMLFGKVCTLFLSLTSITKIFPIFSSAGPMEQSVVLSFIDRVLLSESENFTREVAPVIFVVGVVFDVKVEHVPVGYLEGFFLHVLMIIILFKSLIKSMIIHLWGHEPRNLLK